MTIIIGLTGKAGSGKDTAAQMLSNSHLVKLGDKWENIRDSDAEYIGAAVGNRVFHSVQIALADPMKEFCARTFGFASLQLWGPSSARNAYDLRWERPDGTCLTPREALQKLGTEWGRAMHPDTWIRLAFQRIQEIEACFNTKLNIAVISDIRYLNEAHAIRTNGGQVWRIVRGAGLDGTASVHSSETQQDSVEFEAFVNWTFANSGTKKELRDALTQQVRELLQCRPRSV